MASLVKRVGDAFVTFVNGQFSPATFTAIRSFAPEHDLEELATLRAPVVVTGLSVQERTTRDRTRFGVAVQLCLQKRVDRASVSEFDGLLEIAEQVLDLLRPAAAILDIGSSETAKLVTLTNEPTFDVLKLREQSVFFSVVAATYAVWR